MGDTEPDTAEVVTEEERVLEKKIKKEIDKLNFYLEEADDLLKSEDYNEIKLTCKHTKKYLITLTTLCLNCESSRSSWAI